MREWQEFVTMLNVSHSETKPKMVGHILVFGRMTTVLVNDELVWSLLVRSSGQSSPNLRESPRDAQRAVPLKGSGSSRSMLHSWLRYGTYSGSLENLGRDESKLCENETEDSRPADSLRGMRRCLAKAAVVASSSCVTSLLDKQERRRH